MGNYRKAGKSLASRALESLEQRLPPGWKLRRETQDPDLVVNLTAPDGQSAQILLEFKNRLSPSDVESVVRQLSRFQAESHVPVVAAEFLSPRTRQLLAEAHVSFIDLSGNSRIVSQSPGLFICTTGLEVNPNPEERESRSLKGPVAARIVRLLCDFRPPFGVVDIAERTGANPGYVSRLLALLERQALIVRKPRGPVEEVHWAALIRAWARDYNSLAQDGTVTFFEPRGLSALVKKLPTLGRYALTSSLAASYVAPVAPPRLASCYVDDPIQAGRQLGLRPTEATINVMLIAAYDPVVYERTTRHDGIDLVSHSQMAADLMNSPGRGPEEADALMEWMQKHESDWRR